MKDSEVSGIGTTVNFDSSSKTETLTALLSASRMFFSWDKKSVMSLSFFDLDLLL